MASASPNLATAVRAAGCFVHSDDRRWLDGTDIAACRSDRALWRSDQHHRRKRTRRLCRDDLMNQVPSGFYYVPSLRLQFDVHRSTVLEIRRVPNRQKSWLAIDADRVDVTDGPTHYDTDRCKLNLDGLGLLKLMSFLSREKPRSSKKARNRRLVTCFPNSAFFAEVFRGSIYAATGMDHQAFGDISYFTSSARAAHPIEFAILNEICRERFLPGVE